MYLRGAQIDVGSGCSRSSSRLLRAVSMMEDTPQECDRRHDSVENGQDARASLSQVLLVNTHMQLRGHQKEYQQCCKHERTMLTVNSMLIFIVQRNQEDYNPVFSISSARRLLGFWEFH